jgi:hypothetical protein
MLAIHTIPEMISPQRYLADDGNCPGTASAKQVTPPPDFICRIGRE